MSKVVHLSDEAHQRAKIHCRDENLKMSEWVGDLIAWATSSPNGLPASLKTAHVGPPMRPRTQLPAKHVSRGAVKPEGTAGHPVATVPKKAVSSGPQSLPDLDHKETVSVYTAPPFWAQSSNGAS